MTHDRRELVSAALAGALFAGGLTVSGMIRPRTVQNFLDVTGTFDPSLAWVMAGALAVYLPFFPRVVARQQPLFARTFDLPQNQAIDRKLLVGAAIFGVGWGLWGYCPGPALVAVGAGAPEAWMFALAMSLGMVVVRSIRN